MTKIELFWQRSAVAAVVLWTGLAIGSPSEGATFASGSNSVNALGDEIGSPYDIFSIVGTSGSFANAGQLGVDIGTGAFTVGGNCVACLLTPSGTLTQAFSINGSLFQDFVFGYSWASSGPADTLTLSIVSGVLNFGSWVATLNPIPASISSFGGTSVFDLKADISPVLASSAVPPVPLPAALPLYAAGIGALGWWTRRRKRSPPRLLAR